MQIQKEPLRLRSPEVPNVAVPWRVCWTLPNPKNQKTMMDVISNDAKALEKSRVPSLIRLHYCSNPGCSFAAAWLHEHRGGASARPHAALLRWHDAAQPSEVCLHTHIKFGEALQLPHLSRFLHFIDLLPQQMQQHDCSTFMKCAVGAGVASLQLTIECV